MDTHMGIMVKSDYEDIVATVERMKMSEKIFFFQQHMFKNSANDLVSKISYSFEKKKWAQNSYIFREGDSAEEVFLVKKGRL